MKIQPSFEQFCQLAQQGNQIVLHTELAADCETPVLAYAKIRQDQPAFLFESVVGGEQVKRYSFIGSNPRTIYQSFAEHTTIDHKDGRQETVATPADPLSLIEQEIEQARPAPQDNLPPFTGGAVGFVSYEYIHYIEPTVALNPDDPLQMPILYYMMTDSVVVFDHVKQVLQVCYTVRLSDNLAEDYQQAVQAISEIVHRLRQPVQLPLPTLSSDNDIAVPAGNFTQKEFEKTVKEAKEFIPSGDIIQVVLSQRFQKEYKQDPLDLYRSLRIVNPSPYMFLIETKDFSTAGASPEVHVRLTDQQVDIRPIAGTRPRGKNEDEDITFEKDLLADQKERAEHLMLVDLARNDIGRVCEYNSIHVPEYMVIERYSHVMHIVSNVQGTLREDQNAFDLLRATFPAGTVSGAPKVRAMQIIADSEPSQRGLYSGALGYFSYNGNHDSCIALRTSLIKDENIYIQSGAGIVADSDPHAEYQETINKAKGMLKAIHLAQSFTQDDP